MERLTERKLILVKRKTRLEELVARYNTMEQARFYIERLGGDFSDYLREDERYRHAVAQAQATLEALGRVQVLERAYVPNFIFGRDDIVVTVGQDGLVANTLKYLDGQLLIGVNPDPARWDGVLLPFAAGDLKAVVLDTFQGKRPIREVSMARVQLNDGQTLYAVNDFFVGQKTHVSARYRLQLGGRQETQSSSGIIVSTGLGSTGWLKSVLTGAERIAGSAMRKSPGKAAWDTDDLYFSVREPFPSKTTGVDLCFGRVAKNTQLRVSSLMPENGVIFSDGVENDYLPFNAGVEACIALAEKKGHLVA